MEGWPDTSKESSWSDFSGPLTANSSFDFETKNSYSIRVETTDQGGLTFDRVFTISVTDINETPMDLDLSNASIAENAGAVVTATATSGSTRRRSR